MFPKPCDNLVLKFYMREQDGVNKCIDMFSVRPLVDHGFPVFSFITADGVTKMFRFT